MTVLSFNRFGKSLVKYLYITSNFIRNGKGIVKINILESDPFISSHVFVCFLHKEV